MKLDGQELEQRQRVAQQKGLPLHDAINVHDSLDEQHAAATHLGKTLAEVEAIYRDNFFGHTEDLMVMGPQAFCFYLDAAIAYLKSAAATGDSDGLNGFVGAIAHRMEWGAAAIEPAHGRLAELCEYLLAHLDRYDLSLGIYDHVPIALRALRDSLLA